MTDAEAIRRAAMRLCGTDPELAHRLTRLAEELEGGPIRNQQETTVLKKFVLAGAGALALALATAAGASADNSSYGSVGDSNLGGSAGPNGGTVSLGGVTTSVDGVNTLNGQLSVSGYGYSSTVDQKYGAFGVGDVRGLHTVWTTESPAGDTRVHGHLYYPVEGDPRLAFFEADSPGQSVSLVCDPLCHEAGA